MIDGGKDSALQEKVNRVSHYGTVGQPTVAPTYTAPYDLGSVRTIEARPVTCRSNFSG